NLCHPSPSLEFPCSSSNTWVPHCPLVSPSLAGVPLSGVSLSVQPPGAQVTLGDRLVLSCTVVMGTGPLSFFWHREGSGALLGTGPRLELRQVGDNDSG
ncbi:FCRL2 protein, partial [Setophaga kirtlandii]|nr:FCRL2 protein [Setophaga kirtlandii]